MSQSRERLDEHFFRHEYGHLVTMLSRKVGIEHMALIEDAVQHSLLKALELWPRKHPQQPRAWLYRVACNAFIDEYRKHKLLESFDDHATVLGELSTEQSTFVSDDDFLHMMFICCDSDVPKLSRLVICLKVLCGFSVSEIAKRLFLSESNVHKRYQRALKVFRLKSAKVNQQGFELTHLSSERLESTLSVLYLMFTEGYLSHSEDYAIRYDLCEESIRLLTLLSKTKLKNRESINALLALMTLNLARMDSRQNQLGELLLLEEQDRTLWNADLIQQGFFYLSLSAQGDQLSRYHLEAAIAAEHCRASTFASTQWQTICQYYEQLEKTVSSYYYRLNRVLALAEWKGAEQGLALLDEDQAPTWIKDSYLWFVVAADLNARCGKIDKASALFSLALQKAPTEPVRKFILRRCKRYEIE